MRTVDNAFRAEGALERRRLEVPDRQTMREDTGVAIKLALAGDTMLGRDVADRLATSSPESLFAPEIAEIANEAALPGVPRL